MPTALALFAHPDDIEFLAAGTLLRLGELGWSTHYMTLSGGDLGSMSMGRQETRRTRTGEAQAAAVELGAQWHAPIADDLLIFYNEDLLRKVAAVVRKVAPTVVLTHALADYMEDHQNTARLAVTASFARGMNNFVSYPPTRVHEGDVAVYHALPHGLRGPMGEEAEASLYVDISGQIERKRAALACHESQREWLDQTQGMGSYLDAMVEMGAEVGKKSGRFGHAEGWNQHLELGFGPAGWDPLGEVLGS
jgi:N-acetylglucosamine malate deacetylase 1